jgi:CysZ protein
MIFSAFRKAFAQLPEPAFRKVLVRSLILTGGLFVGLLFLFGWATDNLIVSEYGWLNMIAEWGSFAAVFLVLLILFPAISALFISFFLDDIAEAVEARFYPHDRLGRSANLGVTLIMAGQFTLVMLVLNLLALPLYLILFFTSLSFFLYYGLNGYLLSREYFELVAVRHYDAKDIKAIRLENRRTLFFTGVIIAFLLSIPILNLLAPIVATAAMVHVLKHLEQ